MKKLLIICIAVLTACTAFAQTGDSVKDLKQQKKVLMLNAKLKELQIDFEKEKAGYDELIKEANATANSVTTDFSTSDASSTVKDAKAAINKLKEAKKINKKLAKSQKKLKKLQK